MRHARDEALDQIEPLLTQLRRIDGLFEKKRGIFYRGSRAFLHFHEDPAGIFADIRCADGRDFDRLKVDDAAARDALVILAEERARAL